MRALNGTVSDNSLNIVDAEDTKVINIGKALIVKAVDSKISLDINDSFATIARALKNYLDNININDRTDYQTSINADNIVLTTNTFTIYKEN